MPRLRSPGLVFALLAWSASPAWAVRYIDYAGVYPGAPVRVHDDPAPAPYAMNYAEETARALGTHDGTVDLFSTPDSRMPAVSVGSGAGAPMLKLKWRP